jgi:hypothetical protein
VNIKNHFAEYGKQIVIRGKPDKII